MIFLNKYKNKSLNISIKKYCNISILQSCNHRGGYLMIELIIAISLLMIGFLGFLSLIGNSIGVIRTIDDQTVGNYLAMEGIEIVKNMIDANVAKNHPWNAGGFPTSSGDHCYQLDYATPNLQSASQINCPVSNSDYSGEQPLNLDSGTGYSYASSANAKSSGYYRIIDIIPVSSDQMKVVSTVRWTGHVSGKVSLEDNFFNWRQ